MKENDFSFRGLEMHGVRMWRSDRLAEAIEFASAHDMTALVLHHNGIIHETIFPKKYFDDAKRTSRAPARRGQNAIYSRQVYLRDLLKQAQRKGLEVWIEIKEIDFSDEVTERFPQLCKNGIICPTEPVWFEYLRVKTDEFFDMFPGFAGIILSPGSPESRTYLSAGRKCKCERCQATDFGDWCYDIIMAIYGSVNAHEKKLAVRDFVYTPDDHEKLGHIIGRTPDDVIFCMKATPHDFWPTYPNSPMLGRFKERVQWVEYDSMGQFYGWGVCPCVVLDDLSHRLTYAHSQGVTGALIRTEWERVDTSVFDHVNKINLIGAAQFGQNLKATDQEIVLRWLRDEKWLGDRPESAVAIDDLTRFLLNTWNVIRKIIYVADFPFANSSMFPLNVNNAWDTMLYYHCLSNWDKSAEGRLDLNYANLQRLLAEKDDALRAVREMNAELAKNDFGLPAAAHLRFKQYFQFYDMYARGFALVARVCLLAKAIGDGAMEVARKPELRALQEKNLQGLSDYVHELKEFEATTSHPYYVYLLMNHHNVQGILNQAREMLGK